MKTPNFDIKHFNFSFLYSDRIFYEFDNMVLNSSVYKVKKNKMSFSVFIDKDKIEPIETIISYIKNKKKINLFINNTDEKGKIVYSIILNDFMFTKINLTEFGGFNKQRIKTIKVKFKYSNIEYINNIDRLQIRKNKILKLLKTENNLIEKKHLF